MCNRTVNRYSIDGKNQAISWKESPVRAGYIKAFLASAGLVLAGCTGMVTTEPPSMLADAELVYRRASANVHVTHYAPAELEQARSTLQRAQQMQQSGEDAELVIHEAYLARQRTGIAEELTKARMAQSTFETASEARSKILLEAREREAVLARQEAQVQTQRAESAQTQASSAEERARDLERQLSELQAKRTDRGLVLTLPDVLFDVGDAELKPGAYRAVDRLAEVMKQNPEITIRVEGFTDSVGSEDLNMQLSQERADAVRSALVERGIEASRIEARGYGESLPIASNRTAAGRQENRRVEIVLIDTSSSPAAVSRRNSFE
jgi:outer membrane protein OmpA-like peptidoglycan-associated protein